MDPRYAGNTWSHLWRTLHPRPITVSACSTFQDNVGHLHHHMPGERSYMALKCCTCTYSHVITLKNMYRLLIMDPMCAGNIWSYLWRTLYSRLITKSAGAMFQGHTGPLHQMFLSMLLSINLPVVITAPPLLQVCP